MKTLSEWFDPRNSDHVEAYHHLINNGSWPEGFLPDESIAVNSPFEIINIQAILAEAYVNAFIEGDLYLG